MLMSTIRCEQHALSQKTIRCTDELSRQQEIFRLMLAGNADVTICIHNLNKTLSVRPDVSLTLCCFVVYSTRRFVLSFPLCYFVFVFFSPFSIAITSLGEERANLSAFCTFVRFACVLFCLFPLLLGV